MGWISRPRARWRAATGLVAAALLGALSVTALGTTPAAAASKESVGHRIDLGNGHHDWLGSYQVGGKDVFCVSFHLKAPDTGEEYQPGDPLRTKWGDPLPANEAADISYLLLRYGNTKNNDEAAALAHLLHSWTAKPRSDADLKPGLPPDKIGYNAPDYLNKLRAASSAAADDVAKMTAEAEASRGPWTASVTAPKGDQHVGQAADWTVTVKNAKGKGVADVPVKLTATDANVGAAVPASESGSGNAAPQAAQSDTTVKTGADGTVKVKLTPTGDQPKLVASLSAPADVPRVQNPVNANGKVQNVVSTGGEKKLTAQGVVAIAKPGKVQVTKTDAKTGKGIGGATLRITGKDRKSPATAQDGKPLNGPDGQPVVVTTSGDNGVAAVENLLAPQEICVVEVNAPPGYTNAFDPKNPPAACGSLQPGGTLALTVANTPNEVPHAIPAGDQPVAMARGTVETSFSVPGLSGLGALVLAGSALVGLAARRSARR
ncbi:SpaA isopeptide-forming pilin-related protein [Amycolatopsis jejuensis]|uniref:SpaA isopeptide-forming pilin-related protein n=1 Tax=Amycolatopsis jejuensis TaxID=330084 RepID=UPI00052543E7|nr:SpaA isopeptide-forming pilin-related protein [Amycolatopsis jejuensis]